MNPLFRVEIPIADEEALSDRMSVMREWLDRERCEPAIFRYTFGSKGIVFQVEFAAEAEAAAFAKNFGAPPCVTRSVLPA